MRFKDYSSNKVDFPGIKELIIPETDILKEFHHPIVVVNALPGHPYDFPQVSLLLNRLKEDTRFIDKFKAANKLTNVILLISKKWKPDVRKSEIATRGNLKVVYTKPVYPVTEKRVYSIIKKKKFDMIGWYRFYALLSKQENLSVPGIPVSLSLPAQKTRYHMLVPQNTTIREIAEAASIKLDDSVKCTDHPFRGTIVTPETRVEKWKPHSFIFFPGNVRQTASLWLKITFMVCGYCSFSFSDTFDSRPLQLDTPCQKCLYCTKICPAGIVPLMLSALYEAESIKEASRYSPELCIECGLCSYICPSGIPLLHDIQGLKKELGVPS